MPSGMTLRRRARARRPPGVRHRAAGDGLDEQTLRDVGLTRSELSSCRAEVEGLVEATRVRALLQRQAGG